MAYVRVANIGEREIDFFIRFGVKCYRAAGVIPGSITCYYSVSAGDISIYSYPRGGGTELSGSATLENNNYYTAIVSNTEIVLNKDQKITSLGNSIRLTLINKTDESLSYTLQSGAGIVQKDPTVDKKLDFLLDNSDKVARLDVRGNPTATLQLTANFQFSVTRGNNYTGIVYKRNGELKFMVVNNDSTCVITIS
jgi:hypothetical protein